MAPVGSARAGVYGAVGAIPDSEDLHSRYDASDLTAGTATTFEDVVGDNDLSAVGSPQVVEAEKNGHSVMRYNGTDNAHEATYSTPISQPIHVFIVFRIRDLDASPPSTEYTFGTTNSSERRDFAHVSADSDYIINAGSSVSGGGLDANWHIGTAYYDGAGSYLRIDGAQAGSGDAGSNDAGGVSFGYLSWNNGNWAAVDIGEWLQYPADKSAIETDVEQYLNDKWAVF